jgi:hypothetical protein
MLLFQEIGWGIQAVHPHQLHYRLRRECVSPFMNHEEFK